MAAITCSAATVSILVSSWKAARPSVSMNEFAHSNVDNEYLLIIFVKAFYNGIMGGKLTVNPVQQEAAGRTAAVREFLLAAWEAGEIVTLTAKPVFLSSEEAGELTVGTRRKIPLSAFKACRRTLPRHWRWQRHPRP